MPDGVGWAAAEIVLFLVAATLIGLAVGWVLGRWLQARDITAAHEAGIAAQQELAKKAEHRLTASNTRLDELQLELQGKEQRIVELEEELAASLAAGEVVVAVPGGLEEHPVALSTPGGSVGKEEGLARIAEIAARTAGGEPAADDDLKLVHGIGPKLEQTLKALGISSFRQIANLADDEVTYVTAALGAFKGRIERDDWMGSAAEEHLKKYNSPA